MELTAENTSMVRQKSPKIILFLIIIGFLTFLAGLVVGSPERAWQSYLINFLLWSAIAQGALLFSAVMHTTNARWSGPLSSIAEAFSAFFPVSFILFLVLYLGKNHLFPWIGEDLHGKEVWLNISFLFSRDSAGLLILYGIGFAYLYYALGAKLHMLKPETNFRMLLYKLWGSGKSDPERFKKGMSFFAVLYIIAFAVVLSLIGFDLIMSMDPHWYSTLFGAYNFVKAVYVGLGAIIITAAFLHLNPDTRWHIESKQFHDMGKLFFAFCLVWADFFYCQLVVIWYGNIAEETAYVIQRTMLSPWRPLAWTVFILCFIAPFLILLKRKVKMQPRFMMVLCSLVIFGIWLEHLLLLGPALNHHATSIPMGISDILITLGFLGLMVFSVSSFLKLFPEIEPSRERRGVQ
ncbi:MAG: hypothetical protein R6U27_04405 [Desulfobacterales bacterium]